MASQVSPGVVIRERDLTNATIVNSQALRGAIVGAFQKGPINQVVAINSQKELIDTFGVPNDTIAQDWFVASEFLNYGGRLAVARAAGSAARNAASTTAVLVKNDTEWNGTGDTFVARTAGSWGNNLTVIAVDKGFDYIAKFGTDPTTTTDDTSVTFVGGGVGKIYDWDATKKTANVLMISGSIATGAAGGGVVDSFLDWYRNTSVSAGQFKIKLSQIGPRPGTSQQGLDLGFTKDEFHVAVVNNTNGVVLETLQYLSKLSGGKTPERANTYFKTVINEGSDNIFVANFASADIITASGDNWTSGLTVTTQTNGGELALFDNGYYTKTLTGGADASFTYTADDYEIFRSYDEFDIDFILMGGSLTTSALTLAKANKIADIASDRKDCVAFISPDITAQVGSSGSPLTTAQQKTNTINFFSSITSSSYAVFDSGYKYLYDRFGDKYRYIPCNGDVAGLCVSTSAQLADWYSPAGLNRGSLKNAAKLAYNPNQSDRDELYQARINPIVSLRGSGITLFGDKTALASPSAFDRINVRRLFLNIERRVDALAQGVLFEQNDTSTRAGFSSAVTSYLAEIKADRGLADFLVVCDDSNNTPSVIDRNEFVADIYLQPTRSINYITITLTATRTGVSFDEVVGR